jgi:hypothetical protein
MSSQHLQCPDLSRFVNRKIRTPLRGDQIHWDRTEFSFHVISREGGLGSGLNELSEAQAGGQASAELFMYLGRHHTGASLREIADRLGGA